MLKNDMPWTLHPLPPPMPTGKSIKLEVDKSMPWALHPLPPPVKTKNYSDYYWPDVEKTPKYVIGGKPPRKHNHLINNYKFTGFNPSSTGFKPIDYTAVTYKPAAVDYKTADYKTAEYPPERTPPGDYKKSADYKSPIDYNKPAVDYDPAVDFEPDDYNHVEYNPVDYKHVDYKHVHYKHVNYKSPDYNNKEEYPKNEDEDLHRDHDYHQDHRHSDDDHHGDHDDLHHGFRGSSRHHDDHSAQVNGSPSPSSQQSPAATVEYVSHITIEPSIQIASFSETDMQGDGSSSNGGSRTSHTEKKPKCQCSVNGHRHKRDAGAGEERGGVAATRTDGANKDSVAGHSLKNEYVAQNVGHATEVQIQKSHDITDQSAVNGPTGYVQQVRNMNTADKSAARNRGGSDATAAFRDDSDRFKVDFGSEINAWDEPAKSSVAVNNKGRFVTSSSSSPSKFNYDDGRDDGGTGDGGGGTRGGFDIDEFRNRLARKPSPEREYHVTKSTVENTGRGVSFSVQTPFSVSSFSSNVQRDPDERRSRFRYDNNNEPKTTALLSSFPSEHASEPLDFEQFGLQSAAGLDDKNPGRLDTGHFSRGFGDDRRSQGTRFSSGFSENFGRDRDDRRGGGGGGGVDFTSGRLSSQFSRDFGSDDDDDDRGGRPKQSFRYNAGKSTSDRFGGGGGGRSQLGGRTSSEVLEYFQPVVLDFDSKSNGDNNDDFRLQFNNNHNNGRGGFNDKLRLFGGRTDHHTSGFSKFKKDRNPDPLRLPGRLHESNENLSRKMLFHPSTFDID